MRGGLSRAANPGDCQQETVMTELPSGIWRNPDILNNQPCIAGTRIPTAAIWSFFRDGFTTTEIIGNTRR